VKKFESVEYFDSSHLRSISSWSDNCFDCFQ